jgi:chorismate mutase / prephenate dehydratase
MKPELEELRKKIDALDTELLRLLNERADLVHSVGQIKKRSNLEIYAPEREERLLQNLISRSKGRLPEKSIRAIYREIMSAALALEEDLKIAFLGPEGTWTHQAAISKFGGSVDYAPQHSLEDVFDQVERKNAAYGVVPIENSTEGAVAHTLDLFADSVLRICAQILMPIENHLLCRAGRDKIRKIYSHPWVLGQCCRWITRHFPQAELVEVSSTAEAADFARKDEAAAAIGGSLLAELYDLNILESGIQDQAHTWTRFLVIGHRTSPPTGRDRTCLMFSVRDEPGSLVNALAPFNQFQINLSKIESRPKRGSQGEQYFYVDLAVHCTDLPFITALERLQNHCTFVKILGSYPEIDPRNT